MRLGLLSLLLLSLVGCASRRPLMVVNNTIYRLDVYQDGKRIKTLVPGEVLGLRPLLFRSTGLAVSGYDAGGEPVGADSWTFDPCVQPETWTVTRLLPANNSRP